MWDPDAHCERLLRPSSLHTGQHLLPGIDLYHDPHHPYPYHYTYHYPYLYPYHFPNQVLFTLVSTCCQVLIISIRIIIILLERILKTFLTD